MAWCRMGTKPLTASVIRRVRYETNQTKAAVATYAINTLPKIRYRPQQLKLSERLILSPYRDDDVITP